MELINLQFVILLIKIAVCTISGFLGLALIFRGEESKRTWRDTTCRVMFGFAKAVPYQNFSRFLLIVGLLLLGFSGLTIWFLML